MKINVINPKLFHRLYLPVTEETCGFLIGQKSPKRFIIRDIWPTPNITQRPKDTAYAIGRNAWIEAKKQARALNLTVIGHCHTHVNEIVLPSDFDYRYIRSGELGAVLHVNTDKVTFYMKNECLETITLPSPGIRVRLVRTLF